MSDPVWGLLAKGVADPEKIEEAIARMIAEHESDPTAHLSAEGSLQSHKASEIIDHLAQSVVVDKLENHFFNKMLITGSFQSLDAFNKGGYIVSLFFGGVDIYTNTTSGNTVYIETNGQSYSDADFSKNPVLEMEVKVFSNGTYESYFGMGDLQGHYDPFFIGFKIISGVLYACTYSLDTDHETLVEIPGVSVTSFHLYRIELFTDDRADFYVDDSLSATIEDDIAFNIVMPIFFASQKTTQTNYQARMHIKPFNFRQDK